MLWASIFQKVTMVLKGATVKRAQSLEELLLSHDTMAKMVHVVKTVRGR